MQASKAIHVLHVIVGLDIGGAERALVRLIDSHSADGMFTHSVVSLTGTGALGPMLEKQGVQVVALGMTNPFDAIRIYFALISIMRNIKPDVVQCWMYYADLLGGLAAKTVGVKSILWGIRSTYFDTADAIGHGNVKRRRLSMTLLKRVIRRACAVLSYFVPTRIVCVAESARRVHAGYGYKSSKMLVIQNGYDTSKLTFSSGKRTEYRRRLGVGDRDLIVGSVGRHTPAKDHLGFIRAAALVSAKHSNVKFLMIGRGVDNDNCEIIDCIQATGCSEKFFLLGEQRDIPGWMSAMDVFCLHSITEGFPNVLAEAMCIGLPCITTDVGDARALIGDCGLVVPGQDVGALAIGLGSMVEKERTSLAALGMASRRRMEADFTLQGAVMKFEALYRA